MTALSSTSRVRPVSNEPKENRPDVTVKSQVRKDIDPNKWLMDVEYVATCRFGCGGIHTPDVVQVTLWTIEHTASESHRLAKAERLGEEQKATGQNLIRGGILAMGPSARIPSAAQADLDDLMARRRQVLDRQRPDHG